MDVREEVGESSVFVRPVFPSLIPAVRAVSAAALEIGWVTAHCATYPLGLFRDQGDDPDPARFTLTDLPLAQRGLLGVDVEAATTPIVLVHGIVDNRTIFTMLRRGLRRRGFGCIRSFSYGLHTNDLRSTAERFAHYIESLCDETGSDRVHVIGHSLGGLIARYYVQRLGGDQRVHTLVTLGSPHHGTHAARLLPNRLARQLRPGSEVLAELAEPAPGCATRFLGFYSDVDQLIVPGRNARLSHDDLDVVNVLVRGVGHLSLPINGRIVHETCTTLAHHRHFDELRGDPGGSDPGGEDGEDAGAGTEGRGDL
ncbi:MAG: alpha/beta fold hydrolase, partial [Nocardioidaceae bacterium]